MLGIGPGQRPGGQGRNLLVTDQSLFQEMGTFQGGRLLHPHPTHSVHAHREGDVLTPGYAGTQAWSKTVLSSNPPKSLSGIGINPGLVCNLAVSCTVVGHICQGLVTDRISFGVTLIPTMSEQEKCHGQEASL